MVTSIEELAAKLQNRAFRLSNLAVQNDGKVLYQVNDVFMSLQDANDVAQGLMTPEDVQRRNGRETNIGPISFLAATKDVASIAKTVYDVGKDGWQALKPSSDLRIDILDSYATDKGHRVCILATNLCPNGIYVESIALAAQSVETNDRFSLRQPTLQLQTSESTELRGFETERGMRERFEAGKLPQLLSAKMGPNDSSQKRFVISVPPLLQEGKPRPYAVAELAYSRLDEPISSVLSFTFRLR